MVANSTFTPMYWFYSDQIVGEIIHLTEEDARHCSKVLRMQIGDTIHALDGKGNRYVALIQSITKREVQAYIQETHTTPPATYQVHLAIAPTKNISRLEWCIEKVCELGITSISPILCMRSERKVIKQDRLQKIILAAVKQSQKSFLPTLLPLVSVKEYLKQTREGAQYICHCAYDDNIHLAKLHQEHKEAHIMIGPEGDFHPDEVQLAAQAGFQSAGLGTERLRTETAGVYACSIIHTLRQL